MSSEELLIWLSSRSQGSWHQFRSAVDEYCTEPSLNDGEKSWLKEENRKQFSPYQTFRHDLQRLAHIEFYPSEASLQWRVVPPSLAVNEVNGRSRGVLCGARFPSLLDKLASIDKVKIQKMPNMPNKITIVANKLNTLIEIANNVGLNIQVDASASLLASVPSIDDPRCRKIRENPVGPGWTINRFSASKLTWVEAGQNEIVDADTALFRYRMKHQQACYLRWKGKTYTIESQAGKFSLLRFHRKFSHVVYNEDEEMLSMPVILRPPLLIERALVLCTGMLPHLDKQKGMLEYKRVPARITRIVAGLLRQKVSYR